MRQPDTLGEVNEIATREPVVTVLQSYAEADAAIKKLQAFGIHQKRFSIVGRSGYMKNNDGDHDRAIDRMRFNDSSEAFWDLFEKGVFESALFMIPDIGLLMMVGPIVAAVGIALEGDKVSGELDLLGAGFSTLGISEYEIVQYEAALKADKVLLIEHPVTTERERQRQPLKVAACCDRYGHLIFPLSEAL